MRMSRVVPELPEPPPWVPSQSAGAAITHLFGENTGPVALEASRHTNLNSRSMIPMSREWTFLSNHGHVLVSLARDPDGRMRDVAAAVGITERAVQQIVRDLVGQGYLRKEKVGRRNRYEVAQEAHFRHDLESGLTLGAFLDLVTERSGKRSAQT